MTGTASAWSSARPARRTEERSPLRRSPCGSVSRCGCRPSRNGMRIPVTWTVRMVRHWPSPRPRNSPGCRTRSSARNSPEYRRAAGRTRPTCAVRSPPWTRRAVVQVQQGRRGEARSAGRRAGVAGRRPRSSPAAGGRPSRRNNPRSPPGRPTGRHRSAARSGRRRVPFGPEHTQPPRIPAALVGSGRQQRGHPLPQIVRKKISTHPDTLPTKIVKCKARGISS